MRVHYATRGGRDVADDRIIQILDAYHIDDVEVVTSDRILVKQGRSRGASIIGAGRFLQRLRDAGC